MTRGKAFSADLKIRSIYLMNLYNLSPRKAASLLQNISHHTLRNYQKCMRVNGSVFSFSQVYGRKRRSKSYSKDDLAALISILSKFKCMTRRRLKLQLFWETGNIFRDSTIKRMIDAILYTYKKITIVENIYIPLFPKLTVLLSVLFYREPKRVMMYWSIYIIWVYMGLM